MQDVIDITGDDVIRRVNNIDIPAALIGQKLINNRLYPIIQYLAPNGELYPVKERPYWLELTMVVCPTELRIKCAA
mgnify:FL=1|tara:strand:+ start:324 stop:551 length:228 start_codon:yes stop_codon:yes gene_type:complete